jgi:hypothetical protein
MTKSSLVAVTAMLSVAVAVVVRPASADDVCKAPEKTTIDAELKCFPSAGKNIGYYGDGGAKVACLQDKDVARICGPDGRVTRLHAFTLWYNKVKEYEAECADKGGVFNYQDPRFVEPTDESFCLQAQPEVGANMFEEPLCNYRAMCPSVAVVCSFPCETRRTVFHPDPESQTAAASPYFR